MMLFIYSLLHGCSNHSHLEIKAKCLTKNLGILEFKYLQNKNGRNKL